MTSSEAKERAARSLDRIQDVVVSRLQAHLVPLRPVGPVTSERNGAAGQALPDLPPNIFPMARPARDLLVASLLDPFSQKAFEYEWCQIELTPGNWRTLLGEYPFDLLFVESLWQGKDGSWRGSMATPRNPETGPTHELVEMVEAFRGKNIPTVFWNKEDPPNYDLYVRTAKLFDVVFTVAEECIALYQEDLGHDRVYTLPFSAQPKIHNPVSIGPRHRGVGFAGTYFTKKHPARREQMAAVLEPALQFGLDIFDRQATNDERYRWPESYRDHILGSLTYEEVLSAYKTYKVFLNVNSVPDSTSMCARRIFELAASGTPIVSGTSPAIARFFGDSIIQAGTPDEGAAALHFLLESEMYRARLAHQNLRSVMRRHTTSDRVETILKTIRLGDQVDRTPPLVSVVAPSNRPELVEHTIATVASQTYPRVELILMAHGYKPDEPLLREVAASHGLRHLTFLTVPSGVPLGELLNRAFQMARGEYLWKIDDDDFYGPEFLHDEVDAFKYTDCDIVGKAAHFVFLESANVTIHRNSSHEHSYVGLVHGGTMVISKSVAESVRFPEIPQGSDTGFLRSATAQGARIYAADRFNFIYVRHADSTRHTWSAPEARFLRAGQFAFHGYLPDQVTV